VGASRRPPLASGGAPRGREEKGGGVRGRAAGVVGLALRFALNARPSGSQGFASGKANEKGKDKNRNKNEREKGTLLTR
jgi:hypothetical protein